MINFRDGTPFEKPREYWHVSAARRFHVIHADYTGDVVGIRDIMSECGKITLNDMETAVMLDVKRTTEANLCGVENAAYLVALGVLIERQRRAADTPTDSDEPADASALTEHPAADTDTLKAANEKLDAVLDVLNVITGATNPDAAFSARQFADGTGRFLPTDKAAPTETPTTDD